MTWRPAVPELVTAAVVVTAAALAAAAVAGWPGVVVVAAVTVAVAVLVLRAVVPRPPAPPLRQKRDKQRARALSGYAQRRYVIASSLTSRTQYEADLRPVLEHVLAARLAEHHAVNLYTEPERARRLFCATAGDDRLWGWIDPAQAGPAAADNSRPQRRDNGIPRRTLARLITRLEQL